MSSSRTLLSFVLAAAAAAPAFAADVGVSVSINQPGFYGRIELGDMPRPVLLYPQPVVVQPVQVVRPPIYLHVPPGHSKDWKRYCRQYAACNQPVYFVTDGWYRDVYVPTYERRHGKRDKDREYRSHDKHDKHDKHERGHGHGKGHGKGRDD